MLKKSLKMIFWGIISIFLLVSHPKTAAAETWYYTSLGDSLAFGALAPIGEGYAYIYKRNVRADTGVRRIWHFSLGIPGLRSGELYTYISTNSTFRFLVRISKVVTLNVGGNDLRSARSMYRDRICGGSDNQDCLRSTLAIFKTNWDAIVHEIRTLRRFRRTIIRTMNIYNPYVVIDTVTDSWPIDGDGVSDHEVLKPYIVEANNHIARSGILYAHVYEAFNGISGNENPIAKGYISFDGLHPNAAGHRKIAELLRGLEYNPLR